MVMTVLLSKLICNFTVFILLCIVLLSASSSERSVMSLPPAGEWSSPRVTG